MKRTILVVDDDEAIRALVRMCLTGHTILEAADGARGLALACTRRPDLILLDRQLPHLDGLEALRTLQDDPATASIPVIMLSALSEVEDRLAGLSAGAHDYVTKPFSLDDLRKRVKSTLEQAQRWREVKPPVNSCDQETVEDGAPPEPTTHQLVPPGTLIGGKYRIGEPLGTGGMAVVYRAHHELLDRDIALKLIRSDRAARPNSQRRFFREARLASSLNHPNIVNVHDFGRTDEGELYIAMDLIEGRTLRELIKAEGALTPTRAVALTRQLLNGLERAHDAGILHRDIKTSNVVIDSDGTLRILDFGLAKHMDAGADVTQAGQSIGTPLYMSPEQATGDPTDQRTDLYSVGVVLFELLCGRPPFMSERSPDIMRRHCTEEPRPPSSLAEGLPPLLDSIVLKALAKAPGDRWPTAAAFRDALDTLNIELP